MCQYRAYNKNNVDPSMQIYKYVTATCRQVPCIPEAILPQYNYLKSVAST